jgi:hypothetical protein
MRTVPVLTHNEEVRALDVIHTLLDRGFDEVIDVSKPRKTLHDWELDHEALVEHMQIEFSMGMTKLVILDNLNTRWVIKTDLCGDDYKEYCKLEARNYNRACKQNIEECFAATYYFASVKGFDFIIQERVTIDDGYNDEVFYQYVSRDIDPSEYEDKDEYREKISDMAYDMNDEERIYAMLDESGYNFDIEEIVRFIDDNDINDLHAGNWGVTADGFTVMVDYSGY